MTSRLERIVRQRRDKLEQIRAQGIDPYPRTFHRTHTTQEAVALLKGYEESGQTQAGVPSITVAGRITASRSMGKITFVDIRDGSGKLQLMFPDIFKLNSDYFKLFKELDVGDFIGVEGELFRTRTKEPTLKVKTFTILAKSLQPLPEKWHGLQDTELRYRQRYLDLISNPETKETFKVRSQVIVAIRQFLTGSSAFCRWCFSSPLHHPPPSP